MITAIAPGSYDPVTNGHVDVIGRAAEIFDRVVVGVVGNPTHKTPMFSLDERVGFLRDALTDLPNVEVDSFSGLLVDFARTRGAGVIVKGLRAVSDFEYELQMAHMNRHLSRVETFFVMADPSWSYVSSSLIKDVAGHGGDVSGLLPDFARDRLLERLGRAE